MMQRVALIATLGAAAPRIAAGIVGVSSLVLLHASPAQACTCWPSGPACQAFWKTAAVFDATVIAIEPETRTDTTHRTFPVNIVKLEVRQAWKGVAPGPLTVVTATQGSLCGFDFKPGRRYLVFADGRTMDDGLSVSICSRTREFDGTGEDAEFLASLAEPEQGGRAFGRIDLSSRTFVTDGPYTERAPIDLPVRLTGAGRTLTTTSRDGRYEFAGLEPGKYEVEIAPPDGYSTSSARQQLEILSARACTENNFTVSPAGRITGQLVTDGGRGLSGIQVEVTPVAARTHPLYGLPIATARTGNDGSFEVGGLPPEQYIVGINLRDLPNDWNPYPRIVFPGRDLPPHVIGLSLGQIADIGQWQLPPPLAVVQVRGTIRWRDGTPASGAHVSLWDATGNPVEIARGAGGATAGPDGEFTIPARDGRVYTFGARIGAGPLLPLSAPRIEARSGLEPVLILIQRDPQR